MFGVTSALRVVAVVGISAVSVIGAMLKARNNEQMAMPNYFGNSVPYNYETGDVNNMNMMYGNSRRFGYNNQMMQPMVCGPMMAQPQYFQKPLSFSVASYQPSPQLQQALSQYGYPTPGFNGYAQPNPMAYSRRNLGGVSPMYVQQQFQQPCMPTYPQQAYGYYEQPQPNNNWWQQYNTGAPVNDGTQSLYTNYRPMDTSYGYGYTDQPQPQQYSQQQTVYPQVNCGYGYPMNDSSWYIGCMARKEYFGSNGYGYSGNYYGYDENMPSYPPQPTQPRPMPQMPPQQMMQQQMMAQQQPQMQFPQQFPQMNINRNGFPSMEELRRQEENKKRDAFIRAMQNQPQPQQSANFETIRPFNPENAWLSPDDWPTMPPQQQAQPQMNQPMGQVVPPPTQQPQTPPTNIPPAFTVDTPNGPVMPDSGMPAPPPPQPEPEIVVVKNPNPKTTKTDEGGIDMGVFLRQGSGCGIPAGQYQSNPYARPITRMVQ